LSEGGRIDAVEATEPFQRMMGYFEGDEARRLAVQALMSYYGDRDHYTGAAFDRLIRDSRPDRFEPVDLVAVSMLSVTVPPRATLRLLSGEFDHLLRRVPGDASIWSEPWRLDRGGDAWTLWAAVAELDGVGRTITSKLLAAKRPSLIPVYDQHVDEALDLGPNMWGFWQAVATHPQARDLLTAVADVTKRAAVPGRVPALRVIDVVVWMHQHGWTRHAAGHCALGCDFSGF
jgi:hypothetical protein